MIFWIYFFLFFLILGMWHTARLWFDSLELPFLFYSILFISWFNFLNFRKVTSSCLWFDTLELPFLVLPFFSIFSILGKWHTATSRSAWHLSTVVARVQRDSDSWGKNYPSVKLNKLNKARLNTKKINSVKRIIYMIHW